MGGRIKGKGEIGVYYISVKKAKRGMTGFDKGREVEVQVADGRPLTVERFNEDRYSYWEKVGKAVAC